MSGGVDSSVSAFLLKEAGALVTGVFIKVWQPDWMECNWKEERLDAMRVAAKLGIPFITLDLEKEYKEGVVDYMLREYKAGRTPNPDVMCNKEVKFGGFLKFALENGADYVATGHYAQSLESKSSKNSVDLKEGADKNKDQSYFLWTIPQNKLQKILFPIGYLEKKEVRKIAEKAGLYNATKKDSQGLCFIGKIDFKEFLKHYIDEKKGDVLDTSGKVIGHHSGSIFLTIGERHNFTITEKSPNDSPYYIISKDNSKNTVTVSTEYHPEEFKKGGVLDISNINWCNTIPLIDKKYSVRLRYRSEKIKCVFKKINPEDVSLELINPHSLPVSGQSAVFYDGDICLGGGIIN